MRRLFGFLLLVIFVIPVVVQAQGVTRFSTVGVEIWPEYDRPDVLVIYNLELAADTILPANITLRLPGSVEKPYVVAVGPTAATVTDQDIDYSYQAVEDWLEVSVTAEDVAIRIEYYDPGLAREGQIRSFRFTWPGDYSVEAFEILFKLPIDATDFQSDPVFTPLGVGADNLTYYGLNAGVLEAGEMFTVDLGYQKTTDRLSNSGLSVEPVEDLGSGISGFRISEFLPWIIGGLGLVLIGAGVIYFLSARKGSKPSRAERKRHAPSRTEEAAAGATYCHQCGRRAQPSDRFCRACGTRLRNG